MPQAVADKAYIKKLLQGYRYADQTIKQVSDSITRYRNLYPKKETFVFNDGTSKELFCLDGTIPVTYLGNVYHIPICIWLHNTYPYNPPMCYIKPTSDMLIKVSRNVDQNGKVYFPYLHEWNAESSDILGIIQIMVLSFGDAPPVFSKPKAQDNRSATNPPYPVQPAGYMPMPSVGATQPPVSTYPATSTPYPPVTTGGYPPYPSYPPVQGYPSYPPYSSTTASYPYPTTETSTTVQSNTTSGGTITEEHIRASLLSAVEDKLKKRLREVLSGSQAELEVLKKTQDDLNSGKTKLESIVKRLDNEQIEVENNIQILKEKDSELKDVISKMEKQESIDIDEAVVPTTPLYKQLLNSYAEENATEDAIYYLGEALRNGVINLDVFLKHVRDLSRRQFMLRALMQKCRQKAGLTL